MSPMMAPWRIAFVLSGVVLVVGGPMHPGGTHAEMLANPVWVTSHLILLAGFLALLAGLVLYRRGRALPRWTDRWSRLAVWGTLGIVLELAVHTAAVVDAESAAAGGSTPVLNTHLATAVVLSCSP